MDNYELIERLVNLENKLADLQRQFDSHILLWIFLLIGCALFFFGSMFILIHLNNKYGDL